MKAMADTDHVWTQHLEAQKRMLHTQRKGFAGSQWMTMRSWPNSEEWPKRRTERTVQSNGKGAEHGFCFASPTHSSILWPSLRSPIPPTGREELITLLELSHPSRRGSKHIILFINVRSLQIIFYEESTAVTLLLELKILRHRTLFIRQKTILNLKMRTKYCTKIHHFILKALGIFPFHQFEKISKLIYHAISQTTDD